jgi:hypothetical protein
MPFDKASIYRTYYTTKFQQMPKIIKSKEYIKWHNRSGIKISRLVNHAWWGTTIIPALKETEARGSGNLGHPKLHNETQSQKFSKQKF